MSALVILLLVSASSLLVLGVLLFRAPSGYEDEQGFHFGKPSREQRRHVSEFEPVERWLTFPSLVYSLTALGVLAITGLLLWR